MSKNLNRSPLFWTFTVLLILVAAPTFLPCADTNFTGIVVAPTDFNIGTTLTGGFRTTLLDDRRELAVYSDEISKFMVTTT